MPNRTIVILKGSPRENGNSAILADQAAAGARQAGASVETYSLHNMDIRPCDNCDVCRETDGVCIIKDDMQILYPRLLAADGILIATPIYWFSVSAQTKLFIDRWYALGTSGGNQLAGKRFGILLTYEDHDPLASGAMNAVNMFKEIFSYIKAELVGVVHGSAWKAGEIRNLPQVLEQAYELGKRMARDS